MKRFLLYLGIISAAAGLHPALAAVLEAGPGQTYASLAQAIAAAQPGDEVVVHAAEYPEQLVLDRPVTLRGRPGAAITGVSQGSTITINADDVQLVDLVIRGGGKDMMHSDAAVKIRGDRALVANCQIIDGLFGVYIGGADQVVLEDNEICGKLDLELSSRGSGIHLYDSDLAQIRGNNVHHVRDGVYFDHADHNLVEDNEFHNLRYGVHYMYCGPNEFYRNSFHDNVAGVAIMYTDGVVFSDNQIISNRQGYNAFGLLFQACTNCRAERNVIINNTSGVFLEGSRDNIITHNLIAYNDVGVIAYGSAPDNTFQENDFIGNLATLHTVGKVNLDWSAGGVGNYYGDYAGYDLEHDGVGDIPHKLQDAFEYLVGGHPLLRLYLNSAAADALSLAERSFPLIPSSDQQDAYPRQRPASGVRVAVEPLAAAGGTGWFAWLGSAAVLLASCAGFWRLAR